MSTLSWNCRGLGYPSTIRHLKQLVNVHKPCFIFLAETLLSLQRSWKQVRALGFDSFVGTDILQLPLFMLLQIILIVSLFGPLFLL